MWVPYFRIKAIHIEAPADLRDQVWMPARFTWTNEGEAVGFIPTRYPGTLQTSNPAAMLSKTTDWVDLAPDWSVPVGQRVLVTDAEETALMDARTLLITPSETEAADATLTEDGTV
jgi:type VI secretion system protein ImpE